jgi:hypothetical protein
VARPVVAAYLAHVGLECLLKAWLLFKNKATSTYHLRTRIPEADADELFSAKGHSLRLLAEKVSLRRHLEANGNPTLLDSSAWKRLASDRRPYDARYGAAVTSRAQAAEEVAVAVDLLRSIEEVIR